MSRTRCKYYYRRVQHELEIYNVLRELQGEVIPEVIGRAFFDGPSTSQHIVPEYGPFFAMEDAGNFEITLYNAEQFANALEQLRRITRTWRYLPKKLTGS